MNANVDPKGLIGNRFERLCVVAFHGKRENVRYFHVICDCGQHRIVDQYGLLKGKNKSCGCLRRDGSLRITHGQSKRGGLASPEYNAWTAMIGRCENPNNRKFKDYGARGIKICDRWRSSFEAFFADVGTRPKGTTLGRENNDGDYEPSNVRWEDIFQQARNRRNNRYLTVNGESKLLSEWSRISGISVQHLQSRLRSGNYTPEQAVTAPVGKRGGYRLRRAKCH